MRAVIQRVREAAVEVAGKTVGRIGPGVVVLLGVAKEDTEKEAEYLARKIVQLRIFEDDAGRLNRSLLDVEGELLVVSQFTLLGDCRRGRRPSFTEAAPPDVAVRLYEAFVGFVRKMGVQVKTGIFQAKMLVKIYNDGPVTFMIDTP